LPLKNLALPRLSRPGGRFFFDLRRSPPKSEETEVFRRWPRARGKPMRHACDKKGRKIMTDTNTTAAPDLLYGAHAIADFLGVKLRSAQHLIETKRIPYFKIGKTVAARRSKLLAALDQLENA